MFKEVIDFIRELYNTPSDFIPLHEPRFRGNEKKYLNDCIDSTFVSSVGAYVNSFEDILSEITQTKKTIAVVNGTATLQVSLRLVGVVSGDEVITQALTFVATANAIAYNNAHPIFLDVDIDTMGLSPEAVNFFLEEYGDLREDGFCYNKKTGRRIAACMPMHTFGFPVHLDELISVCEKWNIPIVEDAAESLGSQYKGKPTGGFGEVGAISFNGNKIVTCGGGGAILTNNLALGDQAKFLTTTAKVPHPYEYVHNELGYNFRMPNLNAALLVAQLESLTTFLADKKEVASLYNAFFKNQDIEFFQEPENCDSNYWLNVILLKDKHERDEILSVLNEKGIMSRPVWQLMNNLDMFKKCQGTD
mgnify:CR=1 FL=1